MLADIARHRGLPRLADAIGAYEKKGWVVPAAPVDLGISDDPVKLLSLLARHGLRTDLLEALAEQLRDRPLERGLLAWDVMNGALFEQHAGLEPWRDWAATVAVTLPQGGRRGFPAAAVLSSEIVESIAAPAHASDDDDRLIAGMMAHELGAYAIFRKRHPEDLSFLTDEKLLPTTLQMARLFALAHLPTLASIFQDYARTQLGHAAAYEDLCETLLDEGAADFVPLIEWPDDLFAEYVRCRQTAVSGHALQAKALLQVAESLGRTADATTRGGCGLALLRADLDVMFGGDGAALATVHQISKSQPLWRFARRVQARVAARQFAKGVEPPPTMFDQFIATFGSDATFWYAMLVEAAHKDKVWLRAAFGRLSSELLAAPHDLEAWRALAQFLDEPSCPTVEELNVRIADQALLA